MKRSSFLWVSLALPALILCDGSNVRAAESPAGSKAIATQLFDDAKALLKKGDPASACPKFAESQRLDPQLGTLLRLADCYEKTGKTASAWASFKDAVEIASQRHDSREAAARAKLAKLEPRLCRLTVAVDPGTPPDVEVSSNGDPIGRALLGSPMPIDPGEYVLTAKADGFEDWMKKVVIAPGTPDTRVTVPVLARKPAPAVAIQQPAPSATATPAPAASVLTPMVTSPAPAAQDPHDWRFYRRAVGYGLGAAGVVGVGIGIAFGVAMENKLSDRDSANACSATRSCTLAQKSQIDQLTSDANSRATVANIGLIAGGVALVTGAVLVVTGWPKDSPPAVANVQPWVGDKSAGLVAGGTW